MSYVVLARKYRPKHFGEMVGQEHVVTALGNALTTQRLHHAYLFTGTRGVGKTTVSRILAKSLNCVGADGQSGITATPCGVCPACTDIDSGRFVDYTELDAASNRGVDEVQALLEQAVYKPVQGRFKVFMIDEVHMLTNTAFNAMLKTLEEPPEYLKFVLATTDPQKVPVTVLSRCLQFNLRPMAPETVFEHLGQVLQAEQVVAEPAALRLLARAARGSMRDALSLTDQAIAFGGGQLHEAGVRQMLGAVDRSHVFSLIDALACGDGAQVVHTTEALRLQGLSAASTLEEMAHVLQRMAVAQLTPVQPDPADPEGPEVLRLAGLLPPDQTQLLYSLCLAGRSELGLAPDEYAALLMVLLRLLAFQPAGAAAIAQRTQEKKSLTPPTPPRVERAASAAPLSALPVVRPAPPLAALPVREPVLATVPEQKSEEKSASPQQGEQQSAPEILNVPVLQQPEEGPEGLAGAGVAARTPTWVETPDGAFWHALVQDMVQAESIGALVRELALQSQMVARDDSAQPAHWLLRVENTSLNQPNTRERLQQALQRHGHDVRLAVEVGKVTDSPARRLAAAAAQRQREAEQEVLQDPFVQQMMRDFGGKIVPGSLRPGTP
jgi:DNA polymerase-3 subunit gamma/tau